MFDNKPESSVEVVFAIYSELGKDREGGGEEGGEETWERMSKVLVLSVSLRCLYIQNLQRVESEGGLFF